MSIEHPGDNVACDYCNTPGKPYTYRGHDYSGLTAYKHSRLCPPCRDRRMDAEGVSILVIDDRPSVPDYVYNTVRDRDLVQIFIPPELRGIDGRDIPRFGKRRRK